MSTDDIVQLVKHVVEELLRTGDLAALLAAITEDAVIQAVIAEGTPLSGVFRGPEGFTRYLAAWAEVMEVLEFRDVEFVASADKVVQLGTERVRVKRTGTIFECETATVYTVR
jgi:ketosteroid isomerase-like protein